MVDATTQALICRDCGAAIFRKRAAGRAPERCAPCRYQARLATGKKSCRRRRAGEPVRTETRCRNCTATIPRPNRNGPPPERCSECASSHNREKRAKNNAAAKTRQASRYLHLGRVSVCEACGAEIECARMGPKTKHCRPCRLKRRSDREYTPVKPTPIVCLDCNETVQRNAHGMRRRRCDACTKRRAVALWAAANPEKRRAIERKAASTRRARKAGAGCEQFDEREVFYRDRWVCGICRKRISKRMKYPHPRSVSLDHTVPISQGGPHSRANTRPAHLECNVRRQNKGGNEQLLLVG